jgi:hypothetical protein
MGPQHRLAARRRANSCYQVRTAQEYPQSWVPSTRGYSTSSGGHFCERSILETFLRQLPLLSCSQTKERTGAVDEGRLALQACRAVSFICQAFPLYVQRAL